MFSVHASWYPIGMGSTSTASQDDKRIEKVVDRISQIKVLRGRLDPTAGIGYEVSLLDGKRPITRLFSAVSVFDARPANGEFFTSGELASQVDRYRAKSRLRRAVRFCPSVASLAKRTIKPCLGACDAVQTLAMTLRGRAWCAIF